MVSRELVQLGCTTEPPLHVLTLTSHYPSQDDDADGCFISELLERLAKTGVRNTILVGRPVYRPRPRHESSVVPAEWIRYPALPGQLGLSTAGAFLFARVVSQLRELYRIERVDLVHAHGLMPCGHAAMLLARELNIPYVVSVYGFDGLSSAQTPGPFGKWYRRISHRVCAESRRVVCASEHIREELLERMGRRCRTSVVYNGVDPDLFSPAPEGPEPPNTLLTAGKLRSCEGHDLLVRAVAALVKEFSSFSLEIIGDGPERSRLSALVKALNLAEVVHFIGRKSRPQIAAAMKRCTLFALPNRSVEPGLLHVQAMSCGKAAIGCRGQGIAEIIQHGMNGFLVGHGNVQELTLAMGMLLRQPQRCKNLGTAARDSVLERLTVEQQAESLKRIYRESVA